MASKEQNSILAKKKKPKKQLFPCANYKAVRLMVTSFTTCMRLQRDHKKTAKLITITKNPNNPVLCI